MPGLAGTYVFGDFCSGEIFGLRAGSDRRCCSRPAWQLASFGEDAAGELYVVDLDGALYRIIGAAP